MNYKLSFIKKILPAEICPILYDDVILEELVTIDLFINEVYNDIVEKNELAIVAAVKFWLYKPYEVKLSFRTFCDLMPGIYKYLTIYKNNPSIANFNTVDSYIKHTIGGFKK